MKTIFRISILAVAIMFLTVSCGGKGASVDTALSQIEKAMQKVEKNKTSMTESDWKAFSDELEQPAKVLSDALESNDVGALKKLKISAVMLRYAAVVGEAALHTVTDSLKVKMEETHLADSIAAGIGQLQEALESDELKKAMEELQKELQKLQN